MLLRRITQHVKNQNWFAVFLDFVIVVVGVFIGIQVSNWNDARNTAHEAKIARSNLIADLQNDRDVYAVRKKFYLEVKQSVIQVEKIINHELPNSIELQWEFIRNVDKAGGMWPFQPSAQVYNQLLNAGKLGLVSDEAVLRQMRDYYQDAALEAGLTFKFDSKFREHSRQYMDWQITEYIVGVCNDVAGVDPSDIIDENQNYFSHCPVPDLQPQITQTVNQIHTASELGKDLNLLLSQTMRMLNFIEYLEDEAAILIQELERQ